MTALPPTAGQRFVQARYLRNQARREAQMHRDQETYLLTAANVSAADPDPENVRFAAGERAAAELWDRVEQLAQQEMDSHREEARRYQIEGGVDDERID